MKNAIIIAVCVVLIIAAGLGVLYRGWNALMDWAFRPVSYEAFTPELLHDLRENAAVSIPENAVFIKGEAYSWLDVSVRIVFSIPAGPESEPEQLCRQMVDLARWETDNAPISDTEAAYLGHSFSGKLCGALGEDRRAALFYTEPRDGYIHVLLVYYGP